MGLQSKNKLGAIMCTSHGLNINSHLYKTFPTENVTLRFMKGDPFNWKGLVKGTFTNLHGPISKTYKLVKVKFGAVFEPLGAYMHLFTAPHQPRLHM